MIKTAQGRQKDVLKAHRAKTKTWFDLDDREYQRLRNSREAFLEQSLENYLLCLHACEEYDNDVLRFCALWLDKSENDSANRAVGKNIKLVASRKFVPLVNQLSSRLLNDSSEFQTLLYPLLLRICTEHPYHGMYQMFSISKTKGSQDKIAMSRFDAAKKMVDDFRRTRSADIWVAIHNCSITYTKFATEKLDDRLYKTGSKVRLNKIDPGTRLENDARDQKIPPPTMKIEVRIDGNYKDVPRLVAYKPEFSIAGGVSAPKIVTAIASNGLQYKQLVS
jgi:serine-protein kinase ATM